MNDFDDTTFLDCTRLTNNNFQINDGAQGFDDFDEVTSFEGDCDSDEDMVSLFRSCEGS